ncbi:hypothetical protein ACU8KH_02134 [Lachancea thermotolerans]
MTQIQAGRTNNCATHHEADRIYELKLFTRSHSLIHVVSSDKCSSQNSTDVQRRQLLPPAHRARLRGTLLATAAAATAFRVGLQYAVFARKVLDRMQGSPIIEDIRIKAPNLHNSPQQLLQDAQRGVRQWNESGGTQAASPGRDSNSSLQVTGFKARRGTRTLETFKTSAKSQNVGGVRREV